MKNTHGGVLFLVKLQAESCNFTKINTPPWVFFTFFKFTNGTKSRKASHIAVSQCSSTSMGGSPFIFQVLHFPNSLKMELNTNDFSGTFRKNFLSVTFSETPGRLFLLTFILSYDLPANICSQQLSFVSVGNQSTASSINRFKNLWFSDVSRGYGNGTLA